MPMNVLLVEDSAADARVVRELLDQAGGQEVALRRVSRLGTALEALRAEIPDVIVLDLSLPDGRGLATLHKVRNCVSSVPIVVLTGLDDTEMAVRAISVGAADYLVKNGLTPELLVRSLRYGIERKRNEEALRRSQNELAFKNQLAHLLLTVPDETTYAAVLEALLEFTGSPDGLFGYVDAEGALTAASMRRAGRGGRPLVRNLQIPPAAWSGPWGQAMREKKAVCSNQPAPASAGLGDLRRVMAAPLVEGDWLIGVLLTANHAAEYGKKDLEALEHVADYLAPCVHARRQRDAHEKALSAAVAAKEVLLREVHHRVKNNLQIVASLLNIQAETLPEAFRLALDDSQRRVRSMALVHEQLYTCERPDELDFGEYVYSLTQDLFSAYSIRPEVVRLHRDLESVLLDADQAVPCGLILNELVTNALKHGFPDGRSGEVHVGLHVQAGQVVLRVADTGIGLPPDFDCHRCESLGLRIVDILRAQLNGTLEYGNEDGASFTLRFARPV